MNERRERLEPRLPPDPHYWSRLATRVDDRVRGELARRRRLIGRRSVWWARPELSPALAIGALLIAGAAWLFVPTGSAVADESVVARALRPADPLAAGLLGPGSAPDLADLMSRGDLGGSTEEE
ncbi:MAG: hypothetical protein OEU54_03435 [Gemmatimonadota bacterium]|nr:hypothetical protein [Gemmatimonadota bacterium]